MVWASCSMRSATCTLAKTRSNHDEYPTPHGVGYYWIGIPVLMSLPLQNGNLTMKQIRHIHAREVRVGDTILTGLTTMPSHVYAWVVTDTHEYRGQTWLSSDGDSDMAFEPLTILSVVRGRKARKAERREGYNMTDVANGTVGLASVCRTGVCKHRVNRQCCKCREWQDECIC